MQLVLSPDKFFGVFQDLIYHDGIILDLDKF